MWKNINGRLVQLTDETRVKFRTNISKAILERLDQLAEEHGTYTNYLLENGIQHVLAEGVITYNKEMRPKDRIQYKTTYDKELLENLKQFAKEHKLYINDVIEYSVDFIHYNQVKERGYKNRIE